MKNIEVFFMCHSLLKLWVCFKYLTFRKEYKSSFVYCTMDIMDNDDEDHRPRLYVLQDVRQRRLPKFQVQGYVYKLEIDQQQRNQIYTWMLQTLHRILQGRFFSTYIREVYTHTHAPHLSCVLMR